MVNVSLEAHLQDALVLVVQILPEETSRELTLYLFPDSNVTTVPLVIPYALLLTISKWCQTSDGKAALQACTLPLNPQSYTMVSLLAGARTSPEKHFPPYTPKDPEEEQRLRTKDRKAIATLVNAFLSVIGTGVATWWASQHMGLRLEWRALSAVCAALVVAFAEIILYMIWDSRQSCRPAPKRVLIRHKDVKESTSASDIVPQASSTALQDTDLRHRTSTSKARSVP